MSAARDGGPGKASIWDKVRGQDALSLAVRAAMYRWSR